MNELCVARRPAVPTVDHIVRLRLVLATPVDLERVSEAFGSLDAGWLCGRAPDPELGVRQFLCDLELRAGSRQRTIFRKAVLVTFGEPRREGGGWAVPIEWQAATAAPLFPVFVGQVRVGLDWIELDGSYAPPGGTLGYMLDAALLGTAARETGRWFLRRLAPALA